MGLFKQFVLSLYIWGFFYFVFMVLTGIGYFDVTILTFVGSIVLFLHIFTEVVLALM